MPDEVATPRRKPSRAPRTPMPERDALERAQDFVEVGLGYTEELARAEAERCLQCKNATCVEGCPVNIDIRGFIGRIIEGDYAGGVGILKERNALPAVCGRVCPQEEQCEHAVRARAQGRAGGDRATRAVPRRLGPRATRSER